jgi:hypothetical protein
MRAGKVQVISFEIGLSAPISGIKGHFDMSGGWKNFLGTFERAQKRWKDIVTKPSDVPEIGATTTAAI